jgi:hypothetical protein
LLTVHGCDCGGCGRRDEFNLTDHAINVNAVCIVERAVDWQAGHGSGTCSGAYDTRQACQCRKFNAQCR